MKILLILVSVLFSFGAFSAPEKPDQKQLDARKAIFEEAKADFSKLLDDHSADILKTKDCVSKSMDMDTLKACKKDFYKGEKAIRKEQRKKIIKKLKNKEIKHLEENPPKM